MILIDGDAMIAQLLAMLAQLGWQPALGGDAIDQLARLELLLGDDAAFVAGRDTSTLARWAALAEAEGERLAPMKPATIRAMTPHAHGFRSQFGPLGGGVARKRGSFAPDH